MRLLPRATSGLSLCVGLSLLAPSLDAVAQPKTGKVDEARSRYERGKQLYEEGAFDAALLEFQRAYELAPSYKILFNVAQVHRQRNDYASALRVYERYLKEGGGEIDAKRKGDVEREIGQLRGRVATLQISTNVAGVDIAIDDESVGKTPLPQGVVVNSGKRKVTASKEGRVPVSRVINVAGAETQKIELELLEPSSTNPLPPAPTATSTPPPPPPSSSSAPPPPPPTERSSSPVIAWTITGLLGVGTVVTGVLALGASGDLKDLRARPDASRNSLDETQGRTRSLALASDVLLAGTIIAGGVSLYLTLRDPPRETTARGSVPLRLGVGPGSIALSGGF